MKPNKETYRILVIDDHPIVAEGIIALASQLEGVTCKGATCAKDVEQLTLKERFDLCIIDLELPDMNGFQLISHLHSQIPECGILIYTMHEEPWIIAKLSTLNINGAVSKNASTSELRDAISTLKNGTRYFSNVFSELDKEKQNTLPHALPELSRREKEVLAYLSQGLSTSEISQLQYNTDLPEAPDGKTGGQKRCRTCLQGEELILRTLVIRPDSYKPPASQASPSEKEENQLSGYSPSSDCAPSVQNQPCIGFMLQQS